MRLAVATLLVTLILPISAAAAPFGGQASLVIPCYNNAIYSAVGPPRGGPYIWTPATRTYKNGPPTHAGQWLLGLSGAPYYCIVSILPIIVWSGIQITMLGTSQ